MSDSTRPEAGVARRQLTVAGLTQGLLQPSTRFRWSQYRSLFLAAGLDARDLHARFSAYPPQARWQRPAWGLAALADARLRVARANRDADLAFLQRHLLSTLHTAERALKIPYVFDVDDAIFLGTRGESADAIARGARHIICGNAFLADHFQRFGPVTILPTAVDTDHFTARQAAPARPTLGWSGSSSGFPYLYAIEGALARVMQALPQVQLHIVADRPPAFRSLPTDRVQFTRWQPDIEVEVLKTFTVGLMPLEDSPWARGKCSFKMLTYMSCALPCVVSPVGMNREVLDLGACGLAAAGEQDWVEALQALLSDEALAWTMGQTGRRIVEQRFARRVVGAQLVELLRREA
ncbi:glycosyltransferase family 4 protein [Roseateles flavus]|uniref:Glycosyltransferase family 4 protein n=1 Tax=Roseateles flavus TaxID=3149041 RepID=A0ABV0GAL5_9BURK